MSHKSEKKRKEKYDANGFRDAIVAGMEEAGTDMESISKFLDAAGSTFDYRRYGEVLLDIIISGGLLVPGATVVERSNSCLFGRPQDCIEYVKSWEQVLIKLTRRYKYLEKTLQEEMKKMLVSVQSLAERDKVKLARLTAVLLSNDHLNATVLNSLLTEHLIEDGLALDFLVAICATWQVEKGPAAMISALRQSGVDAHLLEFFPVDQRTEQHFQEVLQRKGLGELIGHYKTQQLMEDIVDEVPTISID